MAEVADLFFLHLIEQDQDLSDLDHHFHHDSDDDHSMDPDPTRFVPVFSPNPSHFIASNFQSLEFHDAALSFDAGFRLFDGVEELGSDFLELGLGLGLEIGLEFDQEDERSCLDWGGDGGGDQGLRIVGFESESESGSEDVDVDYAGDLGIPLQWDCLRADEARRESNEDFEWEEVDDRVDEREVLNMVMYPLEEERTNLQEIVDRVGELEIDTEGEEEEEEEATRNVEWEVLLAMNDIDRNASLENDDFVYATEDEVLFEQFVDQESSIKGSPPASKSVVENLPSIVLTQDDIDKNNTLCAVCKDEISLEESVKQLPCLHHYHGECILPWLAMRNTCPVCRYELPSDDPDYETLRAGRDDVGVSREEPRFIYNLFEMFPED